MRTNEEDITANGTTMKDRAGVRLKAYIFRRLKGVDNTDQDERDTRLGGTCAKSFARAYVSPLFC